MSRTTLDRRRFLRGLGSAGLALPFVAHLPYLRGLPLGHAQTAAPSRIVFWGSGNESIERSFWLPPGAVDGAPLTMLHPLMGALEPFRDRMTLLGGHIGPGGGHPGDQAILTGRFLGRVDGQQFNRGTSLDQHLGDALGTRPMVLEGGLRLSFRGDRAPVSRMRAHEAFASYFGDGGGGADPAALARTARDRSILDGAASQLSGLRARIGTEDRFKLDRHLEAIRALESRLDVELVQCDGVTAPDPDRDQRRAPAADVEAVREEVLTLALACNATRVGMYSLGSTWGIPGELMAPYGVNGSSHNIAHAYDPHNHSHSPRQVEEREIMERVTYERFAAFLARLDAVPEGDGTLLDHTLVVFTKFMGYDHSADELMWMAVGGQRATPIRTGRYLDVTDRSSNDILGGLAHLMGVPVARWGEPQEAYADKRGEVRRTRVLGPMDLT